ncbi:hypothetical protein CRG98_042598 [Punica granatum]|uniref:Uncharacterized protein n=1 Tax=Punica granatum TaxID=22663 RepID=A0A2I0HZ73_PUNGR|nr:hypothetical protein CRG98_042598 [Punica granatum]
MANQHRVAEEDELDRRIEQIIDTRLVVALERRPNVVVDRLAERMGALMEARQVVDPRRGRVPNSTADLEDVELEAQQRNLLVVVLLMVIERPWRLVGSRLRLLESTTTQPDDLQNVLKAAPHQFGTMRDLQSPILHIFIWLGDRVMNSAIGVHFYTPELALFGLFDYSLGSMKEP